MRLKKERCGSVDQGLGPADPGEEGEDCRVARFLFLSCHLASPVTADPQDSVPCAMEMNIQREEETSDIKGLRGMEEKESISSYQKRLGVANFPKDSQLAGDA